MLFTITITTIRRATRMEHTNFGQMILSIILLAILLLITTTTATTVAMTTIRMITITMAMAITTPTQLVLLMALGLV